MEAARPIGMLVSYHIISQCHNPEDGGSMALQNVGIITQCLNPEDGGSMALQNVGILPHHYLVS